MTDESRDVSEEVEGLIGLLRKGVDDILQKFELDAEDLPECKLKDLQSYWVLRDALIAYKRDLTKAVRGVYHPR